MTVSPTGRHNSDGNELLCDVQGIEDLYTDPQVG